jgi:hypothetical protein
MEVNFSDTTPATPAVDVVATSTPVAAAAPAPVAAPTPPPADGSQLPATSSGLLLGDRLPDFKDIILPRVTLLQDKSKLTESFEVGALVYNQQIALFIPGKVNSKTQTVERATTKPVIMTVLGFKDTRYYEKVKWGSEGAARGAIVDTEKAVRDNGGTLDYNEWKLKEKDGMKRFECGVDCLVAIERPEICATNESDFTFEVEGKHLTLAMWTLKGSIYTATAKRVFFTARRMGCLKQGYPSWSYAVSTREENWSGGVSSWIPVCVPNQKNTPEVLKFVQSVLGA